MDRGTLIRTAAVLIALINQTAVIIGWDPFPVTEEQATALVNLGYELFTVAFSVVTMIIAWFKNNYVTPKGKKQKEAIEKAGVK